MSDDAGVDYRRSARVLLAKPRYPFWRVVSEGPAAPRHRVFEYQDFASADDRFVMEMASCEPPQTARIERVESPDRAVVLSSVGD